MLEPPLLEPQKIGNPSFSVPTVQLLVRAISLFTFDIFYVFDRRYLNFSMHLGDAEPFYGELFLYQLIGRLLVSAVYFSLSIYTIWLLRQ
jgi:hypothetical protein